MSGNDYAMLAYGVTLFLFAGYGLRLWIMGRMHRADRHPDSPSKR